MAETLFVADESDVRQSLTNVCSSLPVVFLQQKRWESPTVLPSRNLGEHRELCRTGLTFFVFTSPDNIKLKEVKGPNGQSQWEFDYRATTGWIMIEAGGRWEKGGDRRWVPGRIRANLSDDTERSLYSEFKKLWLKGYKTGKDKLKLGPSASRTLASEVIANW